MSLSIVTFAVALLIGIGLVAVGLEAYKQNRPLLHAVRADTRGIKSIFWHALVVWSPMLVVMLILLGIASAISSGITELVYRYTTIDEFCEVRRMGSPVFVACTGMGDTLAANQIKQLSPAEDIERQLFRRYRDARVRLLLTPLNQLREQAKNHSAFRKKLLPAGVLGLAPSSEDDTVLSRLVRERRLVMQSQIPFPGDIVEVLSYRNSVDTRNRILRDLDARIAARRKALYVAQYARLTQEQRLKHYRRNRILLLLRKVDVSLDPAVQAGLMSPAIAAQGSMNLIMQGLVRSLAQSERDTWQILSRELDTPAKAETVYDVLGMAPECSLASKNADVKMHSHDFKAKLSRQDEVDPAASTTNNGGNFPCFASQSAAGTFKLATVGFRKSVLLSIDRLRDDTAFNAFKKLSILEQQAAIGAADTKTAAQDVANVVPSVISLGRQDCGLLHPVNCVMNAFVSSAEATYTRSSNQLLKYYDEGTSTQFDTAALTVQQKIDRARVTADADVGRMHAAAYMAAESMFWWNDVMRLLGWIALFLIAVRSFLYVFALELFDRDGDLRISFDIEPPVEGEFVSGSEITIDGDFPFPIINRGSLTNTLADIKFMPWKWSAPIARILHGRYFLFNWSVFSPPNQSGAEVVKGMEASARSGFSMVEWRMQPGEEVIFHYRDFYGASVNVQLKTDISLRLSTLLLGKVFFHYARCVGGEGRLLLEARVHNTQSGGISSVKPSRLVAWNRHAQFTADSHRRPWKSFINPYTIVRESTSGCAKGLVIIAPESESAHLFGTGFRSLKRFFTRIF